MKSIVFLGLIAVLCTTTEANQGNFCKPLLDYTEMYYKMLNVTVCKTELEKKCEDVKKKLCLTVTELKCEVGLFPNCTTDWRWVDGTDCDMTMKTKPLKNCTKTMLPEVHEKTVYHCNNVTKQHCTTIWKVNPSGEKVWAGNDDDCRNVTWEECQPVKVNVTIPAPIMNCTDSEITYPGFINITKRVMVDTEDCTVVRKSVCTPVTSRKCADVQYQQCRQVARDVCKPAKELVPFQDEIHKQWCLLDQKKNFNLEYEVRKIAGNPLNFPFEKVQRKRAPLRQPRALNHNVFRNSIFY